MLFGLWNFRMDTLKCTVLVTCPLISLIYWLMLYDVYIDVYILHAHSPCSYINTYTIYQVLNLKH